jgi:hypothetical protein
VLAAIDFQAGTGTAELMEAVAILKRLNEGGGRKVPEGAFADVAPKVLAPGGRGLRSSRRRAVRAVRRRPR